MNYTDPKPPASYCCSKCARQGVKLWKDYIDPDVELLCAPCAAEDQGKDISTLDAKGMRLAEDGALIDQIGWYIPAVPREGNSKGFWSYMAVPQKGVDWWKALPSR